MVVAVLTALDKLHADRRQDRDDHLSSFAADLGKALGLDAAKVRAALDKLRDSAPAQPGRRGDRGARLSALAQALGVSEARLRDALRSLRPDRDGPHGPGAKEGAAATQALADALGVDPARLRAAFDDVAATLRKEMEARRAAFEQQLAQKLGIPVARVRAALPDGPGPGHGPGGPRHP